MKAQIKSKLFLEKKTEILAKWTIPDKLKCGKGTHH